MAAGALSKPSAAGESGMAVPSMQYVLITAARNEDSVIKRTIESVVAQTRPPLRWVIVDDGSTDKTASIVAEYAERYPWIDLVQRPPRTNRSFAGKVHAVNAGLERVAALPFEIMGNLDADVSFEPDYMAFLMQKFQEDRELGVAGTPFTEAGGYDSTKDSFEGENYVAGPCQLFRYRCFREIGGYVPNPAGGVDWIAVMTARMKGWKVKAFPQKRYHHHRSMGTAEKGKVAALFSYGQKDYYLGGSPIWQVFRAGYRLAKPPVLAGGVALLLGYGWAAIRRVERPVTPDLMRFHRREQMKKLKAVAYALVRFKKLESFHSTAE
jgi:biofilm PGA synthesis N-glycosyltransferase PgaC